jgi:CheY-like chemotaxis protein
MCFQDVDAKVIVRRPRACQAALMGHRILIADDDPDGREMLSILLSIEGYEAITAQDGAEALRIARRTTPDLILLDAMMPVMDGFAFARYSGAIRHSRPCPSSR